MTEAAGLRACVLIVDDDVYGLNAMRRTLEAEGHIVRIEASSKKAIQILESPEEFDLILLDVLMPEPTGSMVLARIQQTAPARLARTVFITGIAYLTETWLKKISSTLGIPFLEKPFDSDVILKLAAHYAALDAPRGPQLRNDLPESPVRNPPQGTINIMGKRRRDPSIADLVDVAEDDDEEDEGGNTSVTLSKLSALRSNSSPPRPDEDPNVIVVKFVARKHHGLARRVQRLERLTWIGWGFVLALSTALTLWRELRH